MKFPISTVSRDWFMWLRVKPSRFTMTGKDILVLCNTERL
jgi:hypothetical protein